eukprot:878508-Amphidinium_carterae.3
MANGMYTVHQYTSGERKTLALSSYPITWRTMPTINCQETAMFNLKTAMGQPLGVWNIEEWQRIDNDASTTMWLDHSVSAWSMTDTQWRLNEFSQC